MEKGWLKTGDLVRRDADGYFTFVARKKEVIRRRGENVGAAEIESVLLAHPSVREAAAVGTPSELGEDEIVARVAKPRMITTGMPSAAIAPVALIVMCVPWTRSTAAASVDVAPGDAVFLGDAKDATRAWIVGLVQRVAEAGHRAARGAVLLGDARRLGLGAVRRRYVAPQRRPLARAEAEPIRTEVRASPLRARRPSARTGRSCTPIPTSSRSS
jgi:acyl-CoA synthetase (AMP-forming)/AMP-acid ligase II